MIVLGFASVCLIIFAASSNRTQTVALNNDRNNDYIGCVNAAEAAVEKAVVQMAFDFQVNGMPGLAQGLNNGKYSDGYPSEDSYWTNFVFYNGIGNTNKTYVRSNGIYSGALPSQYEGLTCINSPVYRVISNAKKANSRYKTILGAAQVDVLAALVPITQYAIFYEGLLEFSTAATLTINGRVHANGNIYAGGSSTHTFNGSVTTTGTLTFPYNNGQNNSSANTVFNGNPPKTEGLAAINLSIGTNMSNARQIIDIPPAAQSGINATSIVAQSYLYNKAQVIVTVNPSNVVLSLQDAPSATSVAAQDPTKTVLTYWTTNSTQLANISNPTNLPFLTLTNHFFDQREDKTNFVADINIGLYETWVKANTNVLNQTTNPTILYVANNRATSSTSLPGVRLLNARKLPANGGLGFTVATKNPLYIWGHYNQTNNSNIGTTNTSSGTVPAALMSDSITILSTNWTDANSLGSNKNTPDNRNAASTTVNAALITGTVTSTGTNSTTFSGGVHNLPRLLEDWGGGPVLTVNTAIAKLFSSAIATNQFRNPTGPNAYYTPPTRQISYDLNFQDYSKQPPGIPTALVLIRHNWATPPPNTTNYVAMP